MPKKGFIFVMILAAFLRLWNLGNIPPSASLDEASITYNAYSVLKTGGDEFGDFPLISQRGYDDWRRSTYLLLVIPFVALFDVSTIAARLPAALLSIVTVWAIYHIIIELFKKKDHLASSVALLTSLLLAISPWHVYISRIGHESNACLSFFVLGLLAFLKGLRKPWLLVVSSALMLLSMISYYSGQIFIPLFTIGLFLMYRKELLAIVTKSKKTIVVTVLIFLSFIPIFWAIFSPDALIRYRGTSVLNPEIHGKRFEKVVLMRNEAVKNHDILGTVLFNRRVFFAQVLAENYLSHFNPFWLFTNPSSGIFKAPNLGLSYLWQLPLILIGIVMLFITKKVSKRTKILIVLLLILGPLPATIATQAPHAMRVYNMVIPLQLLGAFALSVIILKFKNKIIPLLIVAVLVVYSVALLYQNYFILFPKEQSKSFQYALAKTVPYVLEHQNEYKKIVFSNKDNLFQSYMLFLYHSKYDPALYASQGGTLSGGYNETHSFGKFEFRPIQWDEETRKNVLYVGNPEEIPERNTLFTGKYLNGTIGTVVVGK